jgi:phosphate transport system permease protein
MTQNDGRRDKPSFTGQVRRRQTSRRVRIVDRLAKATITMGGLLTIGAVGLVCMFLLWVALPLLGSGDANAAMSAASPTRGDLLRIGEDPYRRVGYALHADGELVVFATHDAREVTKVRLFEAAEVRCVASAGQRFLLGREDGTVQWKTLEFSDVVAADTPALQTLLPGERVVVDGGLCERTPEGTIRRTALTIRAEEPITIGEQAVVHADFAETGSGIAVVAVTADGRLHTKVRSTRHDLLEDREIVELSGATRSLAELAPDLGSTLPDHTLLVGRGDGVYLLWNDGRLLRLDTRDVEQPLLVEQIDVLPETRRVSSLTFLAGKGTLLVGDDRGDVAAWFRTKPDGAPTADGIQLVRAHEYPGTGSPVVGIDASTRSRLFVAAHADGTVRVWHGTSTRVVVQMRAGDASPLAAVAMAPKEDGVLAAGTGHLHRWDLHPGHPEATLATTFRPVWYEGAPGPAHSWQSTGGSDDFEPKFGLMPLIFGTLKATFYCLLFGVPLALLAAIYTSEFLHPRSRARVKPLIELMASLPSVVLGFLAGLVIAPFVASHLVAVLLSILVVPCVFLAGAQVWQFAPPFLRPTADRLRIPAALVAVPLGIAIATLLSPLGEAVLFGGDLKNWLAASVLPADHPQRGSAFGGLLLVVAPIAALLAALAVGRWRLPAFARRTSARRFVTGAVAATLLAIGLAAGFAAMGLDLRGNLLGVFDPRNSLVVGLVMGFAVVPIIYTIAEDALAAVPEHLRAASLGAGATPWQTAVRVVFPTALSGIFSAVMVGLGRAVGETMIVVMAVGGTAVMDPNLFNGFRTLSANIATELPEAVRDSTHYRVLYLAALCLFALTFFLNTIAEVVRQRFRRRAFQL